MRLMIVGAVCVLALSIASCSGGGGDSTGPGGSNNNGSNTGSNNGSNNGSNQNPTSATVTVSNNTYKPESVTIANNGTVQWNWSSCVSGGIYGDDVCIAHTVTFDDGISSAVQKSGTYSRTFTKAGTYPYHCTEHGLAMSGTVVVQ